jgi:hypothetical protein
VTVGREGRAVEDSTEIRAVVHARLLGMRLLTLDARVVVAPAAALEGAVASEMPTGYGPVADQRVESTQPRRRETVARIAHSGSGVGTARVLLAEGADALAQVRPPPRPRAVS